MKLVVSEVTWQCVGVLATEGQVPDPDSSQWAEPDAPGFMYTVGLQERCGVELWCSLRAANGPVLDVRWLHAVLNQIAWDLINGDVLPGATVTEPTNPDHPDGPALTFYVPDEPLGVRDQLETFMTRPDAPILEITWDSPLKEPTVRQ